MHIPFLYVLCFFQQICIRELRERVEHGGDLTKFREPPVEHEDCPSHEQGMFTTCRRASPPPPPHNKGTLGGHIHAF